MLSPFRTVSRNFILSETCKPCLLFYLFLICEAYFTLSIGSVYVAAPSRPRNAVSHAITVGRVLNAVEKKDFPAPCANVWSISGNPADCVRIALEVLMPVRPDLVVSGINNGPNYEHDVSVFRHRCRRDGGPPLRYPRRLLARRRRFPDLQGISRALVTFHSE